MIPLIGIGSLIFLIPLGLFVAVVYFILNLIKRYETRANEKLMLERERTLTLQKKVDELNERLSKIENKLKKVE